MLTAMIWRMERTTVVAAMVGGNWSMDETLDAIWAEVTIQSNALLPVLRLMALRAMKKKTLRRDWEARHSTFYVHSVFRASKLDFRNGCHRRQSDGQRIIQQRITVESLSSLNWGNQQLTML